MINRDQVVSYCCEDISNIENYELAIVATDMWECHHRLETHNLDGTIKENPTSSRDLMQANLYKKRPANELIFLSRKDHHNLHFKGKKRNVTWGDKISAAAKKHPERHKHTEAQKKRLSDIRKGMKFSEEWKANISKAAKRRGGPRLTPEQRVKAIENMRKSHCVKILCVETGEVFQSLKDAAEAKGIKSGCYISAVLRGDQKTAGGLHWQKY